MASYIDENGVKRMIGPGRSGEPPTSTVIIASGAIAGIVASGEGLEMLVAAPKGFVTPAVIKLIRTTPEASHD